MIEEKTNRPLSLETQLQGSQWKHDNDCPITNSKLQYPEIN